LVVKPDYTVLVEIDEQNVYEGALKEVWNTPAPKEIAALCDKIPSFRVDDFTMDDPEGKQPVWEEKSTADVDAKKPDDDEDGERVAPIKDNLENKGGWPVKRISTPRYRGSIQYMVYSKYMQADAHGSSSGGDHSTDNKSHLVGSAQSVTVPTAAFTSSTWAIRGTGRVALR